MKRFNAILLAIICLKTTFAQNANQSLSNLNTVTAVNASLLPGNDSDINIGSVSKSWKDIYLDGSIYIGGSRFIAYNTGTGLANTVLGADALIAGTSGNNNTAIGFNTLRNNVAGQSNTANGAYALYANRSGSFNTAIGHASLYNNAEGWANTAAGYKSLYSNTTGHGNTANGYQALYYNISGDYNTAMGESSLFMNTTGTGNTASGYYTLAQNTTGTGNTATGTAALSENTTGSGNTATGKLALNHNITGYSNTATGIGSLMANISGYENTANGLSAITANTNGYSNTASGARALFKNTSGYQNTAVGVSALYSNTRGNGNVAYGYNALYNNTTGNRNTAIGYFANVSTGNLTNAIAIGYMARADGSNKVRIGNTGIVSIGGQVSWTTFSDGRYKKNKKDDVKGLAFINLLKPITYTVDVNALNAHYERNSANDSAYNSLKQEMQAEAARAATIIYNGFEAQEVEAAARQLNYNFSGVDKPQSKDGLYGLRYSDFVVPLVKAVQELSRDNETKEEKINNLQKQIDELKAMIGSKQLTVNNQQAAVITAASLEQNMPNPFHNTTTIAYSLPAKFSSAKIIITDVNGKQLKELNISGGGKGSVRIDASILASGTYYYSLYVDGRLAGSRQMIRN